MFTMSLLALLAVIDLIAVAAFMSQNNLLDAIGRGHMPGPGVANANDQNILMIVVAEMLVLLVAFIAFLMWVHRTYRNLPALGAKVLDTTPGWAVGWYFIPIAFLFKPCQSMAETLALQRPGPAQQNSQDDLAAGRPVVGGVSDQLFRRPSRRGFQNRRQSQSYAGHIERHQQRGARLVCHRVRRRGADDRVGVFDRQESASHV